MRAILLNPPVAFLIFLAVVGFLYMFGRVLAGPAHVTRLKSSTYASGEESPTQLAAPGYRPFFVVALFFAVLHLGVLVLGSGYSSPILVLYLFGLILALLALILG